MTDVKEPDMFAAVRTNLERIGYKGELIQENYAFRDFLSGNAKPNTSVPRIKLAAFAQWPTDIRNACFGVTAPINYSPGAIKPFRALGAPQVLALHPAERIVRRWKISATDDPTPLDEFGFSEIESTFRRNAANWGPQRLLDVRTVAPIEAAAQLDFFDSGLLPALEASLRPKLTRDINRIMQRCRKVYAAQNEVLPFDDVLDMVFRLLFRLIAAKMLIDRDNKPGWAVMTASEVIAAVDAFYFPDETPKAVLQNRIVQDEAWQQVLSGLDLQNLSVETLAYLYENAFVTEKLRRDQSIHATPPEVAEYLIRQLPIHELGEWDRRIFEPFTGHAPFLTAALRRLRELLKDISPDERHTYFVQMLSGMENEPFAREIARYALILADYPNPDGWRISDADAFTNREFDRLLQEANIVLCNPPYGDFTTFERSAIGDNASYTKHGEALRRVLANHPAMFGFVLPRSFLDRSDFSELRMEIYAQYKSVSVTVLPANMFSKTSQEVAVVAAHNIDLSTVPYSYASVSSGGKTLFKRTGEPTWKDSYTTLSPRNNNVDFRRTPLQSVWETLATYATLESLAETHEGIRYKTGMLPKCVSDEPHPDFVPGIPTARNYLEPYLTNDYKYLCTKPEVMRRQAYRLPWDRPKVLVNRVRLGGSYWHIAGAIDDQKLRAERQLHGMWPKGNIPIEILAALINGPVANAYLFLYRTERDNQIRLINQIPVPQFTEEQTELVVSLVQDYYSQRGQWLVTERLAEHFESKCRKLLHQIDAAVLEAYALPDEIEHELLQVFDGVPRRPLPFEFLGYHDEYERAKVELQREKAFRAVVKLYHALVDRKYLNGLTTQEAEEMERLRQKIEDHNASFYEPILAALKAGS